MTTPPRNISLFPPDSKEYASFGASVFSNDAIPADGILVKYEPFGKILKMIYCLLLLVVSIGLICSPASPKAFHPSVQIVFGVGFLFLLLMSINGRFGETRFFLCKQYLLIRRRKWIIPSYHMATFERKNISSVYYHAGIKVTKAPRSYSAKLVLRNSKQDIDIMADFDSARVLWFTKLLSSWRKKGNIPQ